MTTEQNKVIVGRFYQELWNERKLEVADEIFAPNCITHQLQSGAEIISAVRNPEAVKHHIGEWLSGFPDLHFIVEQILAEDERVMTQSMMQGTHSGVWLDILPTRKMINIRLSVIHRIVDGKIIEDWVLVETLGFFQQLGLVASSADILSAAAK
jgi:predicted ester cyclase